MTQLFGEIAAMYDDVRPGYPEQIRDAVVAYHGSVPATVADLGAGTGKGTELLAGLGAAITCVEPDPRMAAVLRGRFPHVRVDVCTFEDWAPPPGGVDLIGCGMAWHWLDPPTRDRRVRAALAPGGTLAVFGHNYGYADPEVSAAIEAVITGVDPSARGRDPQWVRDEITAAGVLDDVRVREWRSRPVWAKERYLRLMQTFSPYLRNPPANQRRILDGLDAALGDTVTMDLRTTLVLARRAEAA
ncbi:class I SAM-dependent methyltransferase [Mangrovihabitans endophyticus]|uniref:Methyltransferase type 11 n=1 Tax=Mangrovihabitans endophyticus TaxID=1751298 RepID=A0A8J3C4S5_9ACTN|nr:class I SAM-dependent methyltransferase [Mangrovihabitans endophyticus]GGL08375.1 methyltransferase type 11 [Mangrovihabitans endophyticus]